MGVTWPTRCAVVVLLALFGLARHHCALERVPAFKFLACCQHADRAPHEDNDCDEDGCAAVESGLYQMEENPTLAAPLAPALGAAEWHEVVKRPAELARPGAAVSPAPPGLARFWQFQYRTALAPRAPSPLS